MTEEKTLKTSRTLPYSPEEIYGAFASAELLALWWGPKGFTNTFEIFEFTPGGRWEFVMHGPDGNEYKNTSIFKELVPNTKIVIYHNCPPEFTLTVELTSVKDGTHLTWNQEFQDAETAKAVKLRAGSANEENIDKLEQVLRSSGSAA